jgi:hypothetical protein
MITQALIECAKDTIRKGWTQRSYAKTDSGIPVHPNSELATHFCVMGAFIRCLNAADKDETVIRREYDEVGKVFYTVHGCYPAEYNDSPFRTVEQVCDALDALPI